MFRGKINKSVFKMLGLTLRAPIMTAADDIHTYLLFIRENKT